MIDNFYKLEKERLECLMRYEILDTPPDDNLDEITKLASIICETNISLISLIDDKRQWFKSNNGMKNNESDRIIAFCNYSIQQYDLYEINDAKTSSIFSNNPFVTGEPFIRFYAAIPLTSPDGYNIGTLCVIDQKPKILNNTQKFALKVLSKQVINYLEFKMKNKELEKLHEKCLFLTKANEEFISKFSHELKTPLNSIYGFTQTILDSDLNHKQKEDANIILTNVESLNKKIIDILDISKIDSGKITKDNLEKKTFDLRHTLNSIKSILIPNANSKNLSFNIKVDNNISKYLVGDKIRLNQIILNLISNAIKFTNFGSINCNIELIKETQSISEIKFVIKDTGSGINKEIIDKIIGEPSTSNDFRGTGFGLIVAKRLIELMGGKLSVSSKKGKGSEFTFTLEFQTISKKPICKLNEVIKTDVKILIFEDNDFNILLLKKVLEKFNFHTEVSKNGKIGIEMLKNNNYDIILMDIDMPVMNGFEATQIIRNELLLNIPIIAITANNSKIQKDYCYSIGMNDYINKPFNLEHLHSVINKHLKKDIQSITTYISNKFLINKFKIPKKEHINLNNPSFKSTILKLNSKKFKLKISTNIDDIELYDINNLKEYSGDDKDIEKELIESFTIHINNYIKDLEKSIIDKNPDLIKKTAHKIKSSLKIFGLYKMYENCIKIEKLSLKNEFENIEKIFKELSVCIYENIKRLKKILKLNYGNEFDYK